MHVGPLGFQKHHLGLCPRVGAVKSSSCDSSGSVTILMLRAPRLPRRQLLQEQREADSDD